MLPRPVSDGLISVENGSTVASGTGTSWSTLLDRGALVWVGDDPKPGVIASRQVRSTDSDPESQPAGTFVEDDTFRFLAVWHGATSGAPEAYFALVFGAHAELNEALVRFLTDLADHGLVGGGYGPPPATETREKYLWYDWLTDLAYQRRAGTWVVSGGGLLGISTGPWVGDPEAKFALAIATGDVAVDFGDGLPDSANRAHFALLFDGDFELQLPSGVAVADIFNILFTADGGPHVPAFAAGFSGVAATAIGTADGARTRLRFTVTAEAAGTATAVTVETIAFARSQYVEDRGFLYISNIDDNTAEPQLDGADPVSDANWTVLPLATVTQVLDALGVHAITISESDPSGGQDGDLWFKVVV